MAIGIYNLLIPQGTTFSRLFRFLYELILAQDVLPNAESIDVFPLPVALPDGFVLKFPGQGCNTIDLIASGDAEIGSEVINIAPYLGADALECRSRAKLLPVNLEGSTWRAAVRAAYLDAEPILTFACQPLDNGLVQVRAAEALTAAAPSNCIYDQLPQFQNPVRDFQNLNSFDARLLKKAYFWDLESETAMGVSRKIYGRVFIPGEATH